LVYLSTLSEISFNLANHSIRKAHLLDVHICCVSNHVMVKVTTDATVSLW
jgi:hypothetical protein